MFFCFLLILSCFFCYWCLFIIIYTFLVFSSLCECCVPDSLLSLPILPLNRFIVISCISKIFYFESVHYFLHYCSGSMTIFIFQNNFYYPVIYFSKYYFFILSFFKYIYETNLCFYLSLSHLFIINIKEELCIYLLLKPVVKICFPILSWIILANSSPIVSCFANYWYYLLIPHFLYLHFFNYFID